MSLSGLSGTGSSMNGAQLTKTTLVKSSLTMSSSRLSNEPPLASIPLIKLFAFLGPNPEMYCSIVARYGDLTASLILIPTKHATSTKMESTASLTLSLLSKFWCLWIEIEVTASPKVMYSSNGLWTYLAIPIQNRATCGLSLNSSRALSECSTTVGINFFNAKSKQSFLREFQELLRSEVPSDEMKVKRWSVKLAKAFFKATFTLTKPKDSASNIRKNRSGCRVKDSKGLLIAYLKSAYGELSVILNLPFSVSSMSTLAKLWNASLKCALSLGLLNNCSENMCFTAVEAFSTESKIE
ncbi:hypothetical protein OGAPHI_003490 [Ogataea philodendri]|uniref:Uncharacterized protein n=1 Tax=Ogataea philodendri TaxID=1378263 RepID=A0A9P8P886_9ASCO|nr:uncharacterized protein OGAPHI_003490 [Ogataea philodendri]KAH3666494.1 hypothetical protein OGAPHI_003490 [Ogataea philodendri]